jgi:hypothetical protein
MRDAVFLHAGAQRLEKLQSTQFRYGPVNFLSLKDEKKSKKANEMMSKRVTLPEKVQIMDYKGYPSRYASFSG